MSWDASHTHLVDLLAGLYPTSISAARVGQRAGLPMHLVDTSGSALDVWTSIVDRARLSIKVRDLIDRVHQEFPDVDFASLARMLAASAPAAPKLLPNDRKGPTASDPGFEAVIGGQPTFLPVSFLATGLAKARSVVKVVVPGGSGSGFLTTGDLLITNHHVIPSLDVAAAAKVLCNYQQTAAGLDAEVTRLDLAPEDFFATSPADGGDDWTAVRVKGEPTREWGALPLAPTALGVNDFVSIIQHPGGMPKQIAIFHNVVAYADERRVQYLTDTLPGSSGSPVFDTSWRVVALHHSGGLLPEPGSKKVFFRNEGIRIGAVADGVKAALDAAASRAPPQLPPTQAAPGGADA